MTRMFERTAKRFLDKRFNQMNRKDLEKKLRLLIFFRSGWV